MTKNKLKLEQFLTDIQSVSAMKFEWLQLIRQLFHDAEPNICESIKYGGLVFSLDDNMALLGGIFVYSKHMSIEFGNGAAFSDPNKILEGKGQYRRHIKIFDLKDIQVKKVSQFIKQAISMSV